MILRGRAPHLPGITVTHSSPGSEQGYLTAAGAVAFGAALFRQFRADHTLGSYGQDGMFANGVDIAVAGTPVLAERPARPQFRLHTLTMAATNMKGRPDTGEPGGGTAGTPSRSRGPNICTRST